MTTEYLYTLDLIDVCSERCMFYILRFFTMDDAAGKVVDANRNSRSSVTSLRLINKGMLENVANYPWHDIRTTCLDIEHAPSRVAGSIAKWKVCFPYARSINLTSHSNLTDKEFVHLSEVNYILLRHSCDAFMNSAVTQAAFEQIPNLLYLDMRNSPLLHSLIPYFLQRGITILA